jgi:signal transduction histidine kinase
LTTRSRSDRFAILAQAALEIERGLDLEQTLHAIVAAAREVTGARYAALGVLGPERRITRFVTAGITPEQRERIGAYPSGRGLLGALIDGARPLRLADLAADPRSGGFPPGHPPMRSFLGVPVQARGEIFGNLYLTEAPEGEFGDDDEAVTIVLSIKAGIAIENARLYEEARHQTQEARRSAAARASVNAIATTILKERDVGRVMTALALEAQRLVNARIVAIGVPDEISQTVRFPVAVGDGAEVMRGREIPLEGSLSGTVIQAGETMRVDDAGAATDVHRLTVAELGATTLMSVPMIAGEEAVAVISVIDHTSGFPFTAADQESLEGLASLGAIALQTARAFGRERARAEALSRLREAEAKAEAQALAIRRVVEAQESERRRIAQDLHDRTAGSLAAIQIGLKRLERETTTAAMVEGLGIARGELSAAIEDLRDLIVDLRPKVLDDFGLAPALERLCDSVGRRNGLAVDVAAAPAVNGIRPELASAAYRIAQESFTNVIRHAHAMSVRVSAAVDGGTLIVVIEDDGIGMTGDDSLAARAGYGLDGMRERAQIVGGTVRFERPTGGGTRVYFEAPL